MLNEDESFAAPKFGAFNVYPGPQIVAFGCASVSMYPWKTGLNVEAASVAPSNVLSDTTALTEPAIFVAGVMAGEIASGM